MDGTKTVTFTMCGGTPETWERVVKVLKAHLAISVEQVNEVEVDVTGTPEEIELAVNTASMGTRVREPDFYMIPDHPFRPPTHD